MLTIQGDGGCMDSSFEMAKEVTKANAFDHFVYLVMEY